MLALSSYEGAVCECGQHAPVARGLGAPCNPKVMKDSTERVNGQSRKRMKWGEHFLASQC